MNKLASHADPCYNKRIKLLCREGATNTPRHFVTSTLLRRLATMNTLSHYALDGNPLFVTIPMTQGYSAIVSHEDADLAQNNWYINADGYATRTEIINNRHVTIGMHRIILERKLGRAIPKKMHVDHINGYPRDNRRENLREATVSQNLANQKKEHRKKPSASIYKGVVPRRGRWQASISHQGYRHYLGLFDTQELAAQAYDQAAIELYGEYAATKNAIIQLSLESVIRKPGQIEGRNKESGFRGVCKDNSNSWVAKICSKGKKIRLGTFKDKIEAARAYDRAVIAAKGKNALTNFPLEDYGMGAGA